VSGTALDKEDMIKLPVILRTDHSDSADAHSAHQKGIDVFLKKPPDNNQLIDASGELLQKASATQHAP
jgi:FixJ family two-component response regulator